MLDISIGILKSLVYWYYRETITNRSSGQGDAYSFWTSIWFASNCHIKSSSKDPVVGDPKKIGRLSNFQLLLVKYQHICCYCSICLAYRVYRRCRHPGAQRENSRVPYSTWAAAETDHGPHHRRARSRKARGLSRSSADNHHTMRQPMAETVFPGRWTTASRTIPFHIQHQCQNAMAGKRASGYLRR